MLQLRKSNERGHAEHGWLDSKHSFSFADYYDRKHMGFSVLRVINEDWIAGGTGFPTHPHQNMEIISFVVEGQLEHKDSMGNKTAIRPGEIQRMSAGTGVRHSEYNPLAEQATHLLQIWIIPDKNGHQPSYGQMNYESKLASSALPLLASQSGRENSITLNQDVDIYLGKSDKSVELTHKTSPERSLWIQMVRGSAEIEGQTVETGDGLALRDYSEIKISAQAGAEYLLFDMVTEEFEF